MISPDLRRRAKMPRMLPSSTNCEIHRLYVGAGRKADVVDPHFQQLFSGVAEKFASGIVYSDVAAVGVDFNLGRRRHRNHNEYVR